MDAECGDDDKDGLRSERGGELRQGCMVRLTNLEVGVVWYSTRPST